MTNRNQLKEKLLGFEQVHFVLVEPCYARNIGQAARAMNNMHFNELKLVLSEQQAHPKDEPKARAMSTHAKHVLLQAERFTNLKQALEPYQHVFALTARHRDVNLPSILSSHLAPLVWSQVDASEKIALVFGREDAGLTNDEISLCDGLVHIASSPQHNSLNLAQAVQVIAYDLFNGRLNAGKNFDQGALKNFLNRFTIDEPVATHKEIEDLIDHFWQTMNQSGYTDRKPVRTLQLRLKRLVRKASLNAREVKILRGFLKSAMKAMKKEQPPDARQEKLEIKA